MRPPLFLWRTYLSLPYNSIEVHENLACVSSSECDSLNVCRYILTFWSLWEYVQPGGGGAYGVISMWHSILEFLFPLIPFFLPSTTCLLISVAFSGCSLLSTHEFSLVTGMPTPNDGWRLAWLLFDVSYSHWCVSHSQLLTFNHQLSKTMRTISMLRTL